MDEHKTFDKLRRTPLSEMAKIIDIHNFKSLLPPSIAWGDYTFDSTMYFKRELELHKWRLGLLTEHGWTFEDYMLEGEKNAIRQLITDYNSKNTIPGDLLERIKSVFPDAKFTPARLEAE